MLNLFLSTLLFTNLACHEPCKNGYGRAADNLCYRLADDPATPCGDGMARTDEGECVAVTEAGDPYSTAGATDGSGNGETGGGSTGTSSGETSGGTDDGTGMGAGGTDGAMGGGSGTGGEIGGGDVGGSVGVGTGGDASGAATLKGALYTSSGSGFEEGDSIMIQAWAEGATDTETGLPLEGAAPRATRVAGAAVTAISIHFEFTVTEISDEGENLRLTAHLTDDPLSIEGTPVGIYPLDLSRGIPTLPGDRVEDINIVIDDGGGGPPVGSPTDTGGPPIGDGGPPIGDGGPPE